MGVPQEWRSLATEIEAGVESRLSGLASRQETYRTAQGRYFQGLRWAVPADGAEGDVDLDRAPSHQTQTWRDFGIALPSRLKFALSVDIYDGPAGQGNHVTAYVRLGGRLFVKTWDVAGNEPRARDWEEDQSGD